MLQKRPNFFIIGAAKSGTSSLYNYLSMHPQIFLPHVKEPHFFSYNEKIIFSKGPGDKKRMREATPNLDSYLRLFNNAKEEICIGDGSTTYLDSIEAAKKIKRFEPNAKIIVVLRNPADRAYASYLHLRRDGVETIKNFEMAMKEEEKRIAAQWSVLWHYKTRQVSYEKLKRYYDIFDEEKIRIYEYEVWKNDNSKTLKDMFSFLEVDEEFDADVTKKLNVGGVPKNEALHSFFTKDNLPKTLIKHIIPTRFRIYFRSIIMRFNRIKVPLSDGIRTELIEYYSEDIKKIEQLTKLDLSNWKI